jgi:NAD(P)-dependent dehydrogenase (short-subunit alcohol dehydrogenase family)
MRNSLKGKVALVTGGSRGVGAGTAHALADDGADVAISYVASADKAEAVVRELEEKGVRAAAFRANHADPVQVADLVKTVARRFGRLDILVNNAARLSAAPVDGLDIDLAAFERRQVVNVFGVIAAIRAAVKVMGEGGRIITVGADAIDQVGSGTLADYAGTRTAIVGYSKGAARDLGPRNITVNVVQPGSVDTDMNPVDNDSTPELIAATALGRYGRPEEIAAGIMFLASPAASYVTGTVLNIDGGYSA